MKLRESEVEVRYRLWYNFNKNHTDAWVKSDLHQTSLHVFVESINLSGDLGLGVKSQSNLVIAGSSRNASKCSLACIGLWGRALIRQLRAERLTCLVKLQIHKQLGWSEDVGVILISERETTQTTIKVPKCLLSVSKVVLNFRQWGGWLRSSHPLNNA